ncbi:GGDEF domain-containing phosphodiesterase [Sulfitobacter sp. S190]|nr:GGDEF domain-containing phosphodiesterase [Sulfitobacter sp. S190]
MTTPAALVFAPAFYLAAFWFGGEGALLVLAAVAQVAFFAGGGSAVLKSLFTPASSGRVLGAAEFTRQVGRLHGTISDQGAQGCLYTLELADFDDLRDHYGDDAADEVLRQVGDRLAGMLRESDLVGQLDTARFAIATGPQRALTIETCIQLAARMQSALEDPISLSGTAIYATAPVGFCQHAKARGSAHAWLKNSARALQDAAQQGPSAIRAYSATNSFGPTSVGDLCDEVPDALENGQIRPWFQPQVCTNTGEITGFEALARWSHPTRGVLSPAQTLPAIEAAGLTSRLMQVMCYQAFSALSHWESEGHFVPCVGINFTGSDLSEPHLLERLKWDLDRFDLTPDRLCVEILETVVAEDPDDIVARNLRALGEIGCRIDLDDFGTANASITSIQRFPVSRIKIDRSFVTRADQDPGQQRMISAILTMAEQLEIETLAEGVETAGEHALLAQLGCDHVQGFGISRPMPLDQTIDWMAAYKAKMEPAPQIMRGGRS